MRKTYVGRFPLTCENLRDILEGFEDDSEGFRDAEQETVKGISEVLGFPVKGEVVDVHRNSFGVAFDLEADIDDEVKVFPDWSLPSDKSSSYMVKKAGSRTGYDGSESVEELAENSYRHRLLIREGMGRGLGDHLRSKGIVPEREFTSDGLQVLEWTSEGYNTFSDPGYLTELKSRNVKTR